MPRTPARSRRRNPDPPQTLLEYLQERDDALAREAFVAAGIDIETHGEDFSFFIWDWISFVGEVSVYLTFPEMYINARSYNGSVDLPSIAVANSERTGRHVTLSLGAPWEAPKWHDKMLAQGFFLIETLHGDMYTYTYAPEHFQRGWPSYLLNEVGILRVPKAYRTRIRRLVREALANDDLATYLQARELAALVSE